MGHFRRPCWSEVGYFTGKGMTHGRIVFPIHNMDGQLVAYAGYSPKDGSIKLPESFDPRIELYGVYCVANTIGSQKPLVLVTDPLHVLQLYDMGVENAVAILSDQVYPPQIALIKDRIGEGGKVDVVVSPGSGDYVDILASLLPVFHIQLFKSAEETAETFLADVAAWLPR